MVSDSLLPHNYLNITMIMLKFARDGTYLVITVPLSVGSAVM